MKLVINVLRVILIGIWGLVLSVSLRLYFEDSEPPRMGDYAPWTAADSSMEPSYAEGDLLILNMKQAAQPGDPVLYRDENRQLALSRIIGTTEGQLILKADGREESFLAEETAVEGVCVTYLPGCGAAAEFLWSLPGILLVTAVGLVLIILPGTMSRRNRKSGGGRGPGAPDQAVRRTEPVVRPTRGGGYAPRH